MASTDPRLTGKRRHLGKGWAFPVRPVGGRLVYAEYEQDIEQAVEIILRTDPGERVMEPGFGAGLRSFLFAGNSSVTHRRVEQAVTRALLMQEPRIEVKKVAARAAAGEPNLMEIEVDYVVRRSNAFYNRVYPFYLNEAD
ncbi:GPW/gp25 family protein [Maribius pontilimi]|uniref:GPW/gp25 family protein n=1 Tax=Palleronia pontilimi TaxID=1964209 RepID=A0A934MEE4_9RHOB|nr:GPW/gp25 family protein [Palleronia pontilimi]MBJ3764445.1 GPW/gp25 family protein [Palleronia pontilimi]